MAFLQKTIRNSVLLLASLFILAFAQNAEAQCAFNDLEWEVQDCVNGTFYLTFSLSNPAPSEDGFAIHKDFSSGYFVSLESYGETSYTVGPFAGDGSTFYQFTLFDYSTNNCEGTISVGVVDCPASDECSLFASAQQSDCFEAGQFQWMFYVNPINGGEDAGYTIYNAANEQVYFSETYTNNQNFAFAEAQSNGVGETVTFTVADNNNPACQQTVTAVDLGCSLCEVEITSAIITDCNDAGEYFVEFSVSQTNSTTGQFIVGASYNSVQWGPFNYGEESYSIGPVVSGESGNLIYVNDTETNAGSCYNSYIFGVIECPNTCNLDITSATPSECTNGQFFVTLDITAENGISDAFNLVIGNDIFDGLPYGQGSYTVGPINQNNTGTYQVGIYDPLNDSCGDGFEFGPVDCTSNCELDISVVELSACNSDGQFFVDFEINSTESAGTTFIAIGGSEEYGPFEYGETFYTVGSFDGTGVETYDLFIYDTGSPSCNSTSTFVSPECNTCVLEITSVTPTECTTGEFFVELAITSESSNSDAFNLLIGVDVFAGQPYGQGTYTVGPIPENNTGSYIVSVYDPSNDNCNDSFAFEVECTPICSLTPSNFAPINCEGNMVNFIASIESEDTGSQGFTLLLNGENYGTYEYEVINYEFGPFPYFPGEAYNFEFIDNEIGASCIGTYTYPAFDLENCGSFCFVTLNSLETTDCNDNGEFFINFEVSTSINSPSTSFTAFLGSTEEEFGPFDYGQDVYTVGPFTGDGTVNDFLYVEDASGVSCGAHEILFSDPECEPSTDCAIAVTSIQSNDCDTNGQFTVDFEISSANPMAATFIAVIANETYGPFEYGQDSYTVGPIDDTADGFLTLLVYDSENEECSFDINFMGSDCNLIDCGFSDFSLEYQGCDEETGTSFLLNFNIEGTESTGFDAFISGTFLSSHLYEDMPVTINIPAQPDNFAAITFCDFSMPDCCIEVSVDIENCDEAPECVVNIPILELNECNDEGQFYVDFEVTGLEVGDQFFVYASNGEEYGAFTFGLSFYTAGPFEGNGSDYGLVVTSLEQDNCLTVFEFAGQECEINECEINIPFVEVGACNADGMFFVNFEMLPVDLGGTIVITGNGQNYGTYDYNLPLYTVGPFDGTETATYELIVTDTDNPNCVQILTFASANCSVEECNMSLTFDEYAPCTDAGQYYIIVSVTNGNVEEGSFTFVGNGQTYSTEEYGAGSYSVGPFEGGAGVIYELIAIDNQDETCSVGMDFEGQGCEMEPNCEIDITFIENHECNENAQFFVDFGVSGLDIGDQFSVFGNGEDYGVFTFNEGAYTVGPINGDGVNYELIISDLGQDDCIDVATIEGQNCLDNFPCGFNDISTEYNGCSDDGVYFYTFDFIPANTTNDFFDLTINGETSFYAYGDLPIDIQILPTDENVGVFMICDNDNPDCCQEIFIDLPECETGACNIDVIEYTLTDCDDIGNFYVNFSLGVANPNSTTFYASHNGTTYGPFEFGQSTYQIGPLDGLETAVFEIDIYVTDNEECSTQIVFDSANCGNNEECTLEIFEFELTECNGDNLFYVNFAVEANNPDAATFAATGNGENYGTFEYGEGFYTVGPFDGNLDPVWELIITDTENADCSTFITFVSPGCNNNECNLDDIGAIELSACNDEGQFYVDILMLLGSEGTGSFTVFGNGQTYGTFDYGQDFYNVGPFNGDGESEYELIAVDNEFEECTYEVSFTASDCGLTPPCNMSGLEYELDCIDDEFYINLFFSHTGGISENYTVLGNGTNYGLFTYENGDFGETVVIGPLLADATEYEFIVVDTGDDGCSSVLELGQVNTVDCTAGNGDVCNLEVAEYFATECNNEGEFFVQIYLTEGSFGSSFQVFSFTEVFGPFDYGNEIYTVGPFASWEGSFNLELYDTGFDQCSDEIFIEEVDCPISDCFIENLEVATGECNDENTYFIIINFNYDDIGGEAFNLIYEEEIIGTYETANLPIIIENFPGNAEVETLTVCMTDFEDCCVSIDFLTPQCEGLVTWPGDGNFDGITNNMDILNMGVAYGFEGPERMEDNTGWDAQAAFGWQENFASGVNYVHADADGNGEVNMLDAEIVSTNYDLTHDEVTPYVELEPNDSSPELFVDMPDPFELQQGMQFNAPIIFGLENLPIDNVYGVAFTLRYDPEIIDPASILLEYPVSWLGFPQTNLMTFDYHDIDLGEIDVAITKIDQNNVSGWGEILSFIGIIDNIAGKSEVFIEIHNVTAILSNEERFAVNTPTEITTITSTENINELQGFELFPNPTNDIVRIKNETDLTLQSIQISDLNGKVLRNVNGEDSFDLSDLPSGVYMAQVVFEGKTVYRRIVKL